MKRITTKCQNCGQSIETYSYHARYHFCSKTCQKHQCIPVMCKECGKTFLADGHTWKKSDYCSTECFNAKQRRIEAHKKFVKTEIICENCKKVFTVRRSLADKQRYCSNACSTAAFGKNHTEENNPKWKPKVKVPCKRCGKFMEVYPSRANQNHYCSDECRHPKEKIICVTCGKIMELIPSRAKKRVYCSVECQLNHQATQKHLNRPTSIENTVAQLLSNMKIAFWEQFPVDWYTCDFFLPKYNIIIECDGDYWHNLPKSKARDKRKDKHLSKLGYKLLRLSEHKIENDLTWCKKQIRNLIHPPK